MSKIGNVWRSIVLLGIGICVVVGFARPLQAQDRTPPVCTFGTSSGNVLTCVHNFGYSIASSARVYHNQRFLASCLSFNNYVKGCNYGLVSPGQVLWYIPGDHRYGYWCAVTWRLNAYRTWTKIGEACEHI
jgi:hypothetical protein